jgi:hypothetical protein
MGMKSRIAIKKLGASPLERVARKIVIITKRATKVVEVVAGSPTPEV